MARVSPMQTSFNGGEVSPRMYGRIDQAVYSIAVATMLGWLPVLQGPAVAAPGTRYVEAAAGPCRLIPFEPFVTQGYVIEASAGTLRFYTNDVRLETSPGVPYELAAPWTHAQLQTLDYQQSADVLYMVQEVVKPRKLSRTGAETFALAELALKNGPFDDGNGDDSITVSTNAATGSVTLTASSGIFDPDDVGGLFKVEAADYNAVPAWEPGITVSDGDYRAWGGRVYQCAAGGAGRTGTVPPIHTEGTEWDGMGAGTDINEMGPYGVQWTYVHDRFGILEITAYSNATQVTATVKKRLPSTGALGATWRWAFGAFSARRGWPTAVAIWNERLILGKDATVYGSVVGDYENFAERNSDGDVTKDMGFRVTLPDPNRIVWLAADRQLLIGTARREYICGPASSGEAFGPGNVTIQTQSKHGCKAARPLDAHDKVLFIQRAGRKLRELSYDALRDRYHAPDLTRFAEHIGQPGLVELAWQQEPEGLVWAVRGDGSLAAMTYDPEQQVMGWSRRILGGGMQAKSLTCISDPEGVRSQLWLSIETKEGDHWILRQEKIWETGDDQKDAFFVDAGLSHDGEPVTGGSVPHLAGKTVQVLADGKPHPDIIVAADGAWTIGYAASKVQLGFGFDARLKTLRPEAGGEDGTAQGKMKRISRATLRLIETLGIRVAVQDGQMEPVETRLPADAMDQAVPLYTGDIPRDLVGSYDRDGQITIERFQPTPATLAAIMYEMGTGQR